MKILVTGGAGFIGSHLCGTLLEQGNDVVCLDNLFTGSERNIAPFRNNSRFSFIHHDVTTPFDVDVEMIFNLACPASPVHYQKSPVETVRTNVLGAINCLELSKRLGGVPVLQASTSEVYGDPEVHPQVESYRGNVNPIGPRACYDEGKRCAETLFFDYHREDGIPIKVIRIFNTYGPSMSWDDGRVVSNFIVQALNHKPLTLYGDGSQTRSFCYVTDLVSGMLAMMRASDFVGPVNLGNPGEFTMRQLAEMVITMTGSKSVIINEPLPADDPRQRKPDISLAKEKLGWEPRVPLEQGLGETIEYFKTVL